MRRWTGTIVRAGLLCWAVAPLEAQTRRGVEWHWTGDAEPARAVTIDAVRADVRVLPAPGGEIEVRAVMSGVKDHPETVAMVVDTAGHGLTFRTFYSPSHGARSARRRECLPVDQLHGDFWHSDVRATVTLRVPPGLDVAVRVMWGDIEAKSLPNPLRLYTQNGSIR